MNRKIPFNLPFLTGLELINFKNLIKKKNFAGRGFFTQKCEKILSKKYKRNILLTTSCTHALEIIAFLLNIKKGDEIIVPSYTFVSTASAFAVRGAKIIFADSQSINPCISVESILKKITKKTKAICIVHYAGISCDMEKIVKICKKRKIKLIEDCAHSYDAYGYKKRLGTFGDFSTLSFHTTKNIVAGEGGALIIKKKSDYNKCKIILEKGTNRSRFINGEIKKYSWIELGSSYELSEINASFLYAQIKSSRIINQKRIKIFNLYNKYLLSLSKKNFFELPNVPNYSKINGHIYYIVLNNKNLLKKLLEFSKKNGVILYEHYESLHKSKYILKSRKLEKLKNSEKFESRLLRLPIYPSLKYKDFKKIINIIKIFFKNL